MAVLLPTFIQMTEESAASLRVRQMIARADLSVTAADAYVDVPADFLAERTAMIDEYEVEYITPEAMDSMQWRDLDPARPEHYTYIDGQLQLYPVPDQNYTLTLTYYQKIPALTESSSNWLFDGFPEVYRDGCMVGVALKTRDTEALTIYQGRFQADLARITQDFKDKMGRPLQADRMFMQRPRLFNSNFI